MTVNSQVQATRDQIAYHLATHGPTSCSEIMAELSLTKSKVYYALRDPRFTQLSTNAAWTIANGENQNATSAPVDDDDSAPGPLDDLIPPDPLMAAAWLGCVQYTLGNTEMMEAFRRETGTTWTPPRNGIEAMIDDATGATLTTLRAFLAWHNEEILGDIDLAAGESSADGED